jgi:hypothetical protein
LNNGTDADVIESPGQRGQVDLQAAFLRDIPHRERHDDRALHVQQLLHKVKPLVEVGGIDHGQDGIGRLRPLHAPENDVDRDLLFERVSREAVGAWKVDQLDQLTVSFQRADVAFDRHARVVSDPLP